MELSKNLYDELHDYVYIKASDIFNNTNVIINDTFSIDYPNIRSSIKDYISELPVYSLSDLGLSNSNINSNFSVTLSHNIPNIVVNLQTDSNISNSKFLGIYYVNSNINFNGFIGTVWLKGWYD